MERRNDVERRKRLSGKLGKGDKVGKDGRGKKRARNDSGKENVSVVSCLVCSSSSGGNKKWLGCDRCDAGWYHRACLTKDERTEATASNDWLCELCKIADLQHFKEKKLKFWKPPL